ncbi:MAG: polysaccharide lyase family 8 super-sandwich domain-containing protein, partial [Ferruginibacter sp.]
DWQKIPGTTVVQRPELPPFKEIAKKGKSSFVGAVSDGNYGAAAFDFSSVHDPLTAHKSWFFFNDEYVCLGEGINSIAEFPVATTLNQCLLNNEVVAKTNKSRQIIKKGEHRLTGASWIYHDGVGYIFPAPTSVNLDNKLSTGNWRQINHQDWATKDTIQRELFSLWLDHGIKPINAGYAYIVVPGIEAASIDSYQKNQRYQSLPIHQQFRLFNIKN